jgi:uncharacterized membrane protein
MRRSLRTLADGLFHVATYLFTLIGLTVLWRASARSGVTWSARVLIGAILIGWGSFTDPCISTEYFILGSWSGKPPPHPHQIC